MIGLVIVIWSCLIMSNIERLHYEITKRKFSLIASGIYLIFALIATVIVVVAGVK